MFCKTSTWLSVHRMCSLPASTSPVCISLTGISVRFCRYASCAQPRIHLWTHATCSTPHLAWAAYFASPNQPGPHHENSTTNSTTNPCLRAPPHGIVRLACAQGCSVQLFYTFLPRRGAAPGAKADTQPLDFPGAAQRLHMHAYSQLPRGTESVALVLMPHASSACTLFRPGCPTAPLPLVNTVKFKPLPARTARLARRYHKQLCRIHSTRKHIYQGQHTPRTQQ